MPRPPSYATKKEFAQHKKEVAKQIKAAVKGLKSWDVKQDKKLLKRRKS